MSDKPDRRRDRSHRALAAALLSLLRERDWPEITVQEICDRADVARATFYAHFDTRQDLLDAVFRVTAADLRAEVAARGGRYPALGWLVAHVHEGRAFHRRMRGSGAGQIIQARFRQATGQLLCEDLARLGLPLDDLAAAMVTGAAFAAIDHWLSAVDAEDPILFGARLGPRLEALAQSLRPR